MATTTQIIEKAQALGKLIAEHDAARRFVDAVNRLRDDTDAQRVLTDMNRHTDTIAEKQAKGEPIEVADKHKLEDLRAAVAQNAVLGQFQMAQMDYLDLMRKVDDAIAGQNEGLAAGGISEGGGSGADAAAG